MSLLFATPGSILLFLGLVIGSVVEHLPAMTPPGASSPSPLISLLASLVVILALSTWLLLILTLAGMLKSLPADGP